tara:strand:- start:166 stop:876 length:711 start_codon:yes stop_codon:yes gene_type:complete
MNTFLLRFVACLFVAISSSSHAALYDRGSGLIYDDVLNVTWMQDANYAQTSGYAAANALGFLHSSSINIQVEGRMGWYAANAWAAQLEYAGYDDWRLPSAGNAPGSGYNVTTGELGHMFWNNLGNNSVVGSILSNMSFTDAKPGGGTESFLNVQNYAYWNGEEYAPDTREAWAFYTLNGGQDHNWKRFSAYIWAVRDGDVSVAGRRPYGTVPVPAAAWLFGTALLGLLVARRKNKK